VSCITDKQLTWGSSTHLPNTTVIPFLIGIASLRTSGTSIGSHTFLRWILSWIPCVDRRCCFDLCILVVCNEEATKLTDHNHGEGPSIDYHGSSAVEHVRRWEGLGWRMCL